ncbi:MAG TPA: helix-turn-helix domain-containing protein [Aeromicrobium sp.]|nr:helix-turn-helix domain-containing protein [Aeromicrobium sp.]HKY57947.1 helix-turn-helix domain-containing protein [Aeromicrobium sp.]
MSDLRLSAPVLDAMRADLPVVAEQVVAAVIAEVPAYSEPFRGSMGRNIETAVAMALTGFLESLAGAEPSADRVQQVLGAAYRLGEGEARSGRSMDALAAAYRIGTHRAWDILSEKAVDAGLPAGDIARFAGLVFDFLDQLSAVSVAGHAGQLAQDDRLRERHRTALAHALLAGQPEDQVRDIAERADWPIPEQLIAAVVPRSTAPTVRAQLDPDTLELDADITALSDWPQHLVLLVPGGAADASGRRMRRAVLDALAQADAVVGPSRPWLEARSSLERAVRVLKLRTSGLGEDGAALGGAVDTERHLADVVLMADEVARADLRELVLRPMAELRPSAVEKLTETLRAWLLHQGRRDDIAAALFVHPQTVRYRLGQLRELYGERLDDPAFIRDASVALA